MSKAPSMCPNLSDETQFRLNKINEYRDYFIVEIQERESMNKRLSKYAAAFEYFDKALIILFATGEGVTIASFASVICTAVGIATASFNYRNHKETVENNKE